MEAAKRGELLEIKRKVNEVPWIRDGKHGSLVAAACHGQQRAAGDNATRISYIFRYRHGSADRF